MKEILSNALLVNGKLIPRRCTHDYFTKVGIGHLIPSIMDVNPTAEFGDCIKAIVYGAPEPVCETCNGVITSWDKRKQKWNSFCSHTCMHNDPNISEKRKAIWTPEVKASAKENREKYYQEKFGVDHNSQVKEISDLMKSSMKKTMQKKSKEDTDKRVALYRTTRMGHTVNLVDDKEWLVEQYETKEKSVNQISKEFSISESAIKNAIIRHGIEYVPERYNQMFVSIEEDSLYKFIKITKPDAVQSYRVDGKELDIFIPSLNIGIEYNGCYFHSDKFREVDYHANKVEHFSKLGIRVIQIWSDSWLCHAERTKSFLLNILQPKKPIGARKTTCALISQPQYDEFMERFHMQGSTTTGIRVGVFFEGELKSVMGFRKIAENINKTGYELIRFANDNVVGSFSKALKFFKQSHEGDIYSFGDLETVDPRKNVYLTNGFKEINRIKPDYKYFDRRTGERTHKFNYRKSKFKKLGFDIEGKTERQLADSYGLIRCYDSGKVLYMI
jgi:very-short-patch-repair endonuclease